jgi:protein amnionless
MVSTFFTVIYIHFYDNNVLPRLSAFVRNRNLFNSPFVFARFDPHNEDESPIDIDIQTERIDNINSSFHNPMYQEVTEPAKVLDDNNEESDKSKDEDESAIYTEVELQEK